MIDSLLRDLTAFPHRGATTACEKEAAALLAQTLTDLGASVRKEAFRTPRTYVTIVYWLIGGLLAGLLITSFSTIPIISWLSVGWIWTFIAMAWLYFNWRYSPVTQFPVQHTSFNVIGRWPAKTENGVQKIILMAHYDTAPVSALYSPKQVDTFRWSLIISLLIMVLAGILATVETAVGLSAFWQGTKMATIAYLVLQAVLGTVGYIVHGFTNGASDNATGVVAAIATADRLRQLTIPTLEVEVVLTSAEEVGMIGAHNYVRQHKAGWHPDQTAIVNFDTLGAGTLTIIEQTGTVEVIRYNSLLTKLAKNIAKRPEFSDRVKAGRWHTADFDSVWFVREKLPVLALAALDEQGRMPRIHRPEDSLAAVDVTPMWAAIDLAEAVLIQWTTTRNELKLTNP